jgi:2-hydroxychromene-2-carboxylate isomerase
MESGISFCLIAFWTHEKSLTLAENATETAKETGLDNREVAARVSTED